MASFGDTVTLINRTSKVLSVRFDGRDYPIDPGENLGFPRTWVWYAKQQNKRMGSEHLYDPNQYVSLVGVKDTKDDCSPIEQSDAPQCLDRSDEKAYGKRSKVIKGTPATPFEASYRGGGEEGGFSGRP